MENALSARRWPQRLGQLLVLAIILCLPLFDSSLGNAQSPPDRKHGDSLEKFSDGDLSRGAAKGLHEGGRARSESHFCRTDDEHSGDARRRRSVHRRGQQRARQYRPRQYAAQGCGRNQRPGSSVASHPTEYHEPQRISKARKSPPPELGAIATFMVKQVLTKHGLDGNKDVILPRCRSRAINCSALLGGAIRCRRSQRRAALCCARQGNERDVFSWAMK